MRSFQRMQEIAAELEPKLADWDDCWVWISGYSRSSVSILTLWLYAYNRESSFEIRCLNPESIRSRFRWGPSRLRVSAMEDEPRNWLILRDNAAKFEVRCASINTAILPPPHWTQKRAESPSNPETE